MESLGFVPTDFTALEVATLYKEARRFESQTEFKKKEREERPKQEVGDLEEVAGPGLVRVIVQEGGPGLASLLPRSSMAHMLLDRASTHLDAQRE